MKHHTRPVMSIIQAIVPPLLLWVAGFFFAMLWFMLMADTLASGMSTPIIPEETLGAIRSFYHTIFGPMTWFIKIVFALGLLSMTLQLTIKSIPWYFRWPIFITNVPPIFMAALYIIPTADRFIENTATPEIQSQLARTIYTGHIIAASCVIFMIIMQFIVILRYYKRTDL